MDIVEELRTSFVRKKEINVIIEKRLEDLKNFVNTSSSLKTVKKISKLIDMETWLEIKNSILYFKEVPEDYFSPFSIKYDKDDYPLIRLGAYIGDAECQVVYGIFYGQGAVDRNQNFLKAAKWISKALCNSESLLPQGVYIRRLAVVLFNLRLSYLYDIALIEPKLEKRLVKHLTDLDLVAD